MMSDMAPFFSNAIRAAFKITDSSNTTSLWCDWHFLVVIKAKISQIEPNNTIYINNKFHILRNIPIQAKFHEELDSFKKELKLLKGIDGDKNFLVLIFRKIYISKL